MIQMDVKTKIKCAKITEIAFVYCALQFLFFRIGSIVQNRQAKIWLQPDWLFRWTSLYKRQENCVRILHEFSNKVRVKSGYVVSL
jgi:hypothetical protein